MCSEATKANGPFYEHRCEPRQKHAEHHETKSLHRVVETHRCSKRQQRPVPKVERVAYQPNVDQKTPGEGLRREQRSTFLLPVDCHRENSGRPKLGPQPLSALSARRLLRCIEARIALLKKPLFDF
jgi:hypothetical protein